MLKTPGAVAAKKAARANMFSGLASRLEETDVTSKDYVKVSNFAMSNEIPSNAEKLLKVADAEHMPSLKLVCQNFPDSHKPKKNAVEPKNS